MGQIFVAFSEYLFRRHPMNKYKWYCRKTINTLRAPVAKACGSKNNLYHTHFASFFWNFFFFAIIIHFEMELGKMDCEQSQLLLICIVRPKIIYVLFFLQTKMLDVTALNKVQLFWEGHKNLHNLPHGLDGY